jgi:hypothetical protein
MRYIKTYEAIKINKNPYSVLTCRNVTINDNVLDMEESKQKIQYIAKVFGNFECVDGFVYDDTYDLDFGDPYTNKQGDVVGLTVMLEMTGDFHYKGKVNTWNNIILIREDEGDDGTEYKFQFDFHPVDKNQKFDFEQFKINIDRMKEWIENPESYELYKNAVKYNL